MPLKEATLQRLLERAQARQSRLESRLDENSRRKHAIWRRVSARVRQLEERLGRRNAVVNLDESLKQAKADGEASESEGDEG